MLGVVITFKAGKCRRYCISNKPGGLDSRDKFFFVSVETFQLRLCLVQIFVEIVKICRDELRFVEKLRHYGDILSMKMTKSLDEL